MPSNISAEVLEILPSEVVAFGDKLQWWTNVFVLLVRPSSQKNAVPELKEIANLVIADHDTGSVIAYMEELVCQSN